MPNIKGGNKYYRRSRVSEWKFRLLIRYFALDLSASDTARLTRLTRKSATEIFLKVRRRIAEESARHSPVVTGEIKLDESHSCTVCICGKRSCGISNRTPVFALLKHNEGIYTALIPDCKKASLRAVIRHLGSFDGPVELNGWHGFDGLIDVEHGKPFKVRRKAAKVDRVVFEITDKQIENFWNYARRRLEKFYGVPNRTFHLHLKECEWRFNLQRRDPYVELLNLLRGHPL